MPCDRLYCLTVGFEFIPYLWAVEGETDESPIRLPLTAVLARSEGRWFLFDTGLGPEFRDVEFSRRWYTWGDPEMPGEDPDPLLDQLRQCGVGIDEIDTLVMSHMHVDHTGGIARYFADGRRVFIQGAELDFGLSDAAEPAQYRPHYDNPDINGAGPEPRPPREPTSPTPSSAVPGLASSGSPGSGPSPGGPRGAGGPGGASGGAGAAAGAAPAVPVVPV